MRCFGGTLLIGSRRLGRRRSLLRDDNVRPTLGFAQVLAYDLGKDFHPIVFRSSAVGVEVDCLPVRKAYPKALFDEHVAFFLFREGRFSSSAGFAGSFFLDQ